MNDYTTTPLDGLDIPAGIQFWVGTRRFVQTAAWRWDAFGDLATCRAALLRGMNSTVLAEIRISLYVGASRWPVEVIELGRSHAQAPWTCPRVPEWRPETRDLVAAAVMAAEQIIRDHQRAR